VSYYLPRGGHPAQTELTTDRAVFTEAYAVLPRGTMRDITASRRRRPARHARQHRHLRARQAITFPETHVNVIRTER
jgi:glyoxylate utilization-related uncharacterized protein